MSKLVLQLPLKDQNGGDPRGCNNPKLITGAATTTIFESDGYFMGGMIWGDVDGGTLYFTDIDDQTIPGIPNNAAKGKLDWPGRLEGGEIELRNGLKVVTENCVGLVMSIYSRI